MTLEQILEIIERYKLRIPPTVYYELLADIREAEEEQKPTTKNDLGVDAVSRQQAIERLKLNFPISDGADNSRDRHRYMQALADIQAIRELPSVTPQEPTGKKFTKADIDAIVKAINTGWELRVNEILDKIREQMKDYLRGVEITLEVLVENDPLRPKMEGAEDTLKECLELIDKAETEGEDDGKSDNN